VKNIKGGYFGRERFVLTCWAYRILPYLGFDYCRLEEWGFILKHLPRGKDLRILDVGCVASLFIHELARYGKVIGMDSRPYFENLPKAIQFIQGDALRMPFPDDSFDCITIVSVIEHIGLGSYHDPVANDGDFKAMDELRRVLKKDGALFVTTITGSEYSIAMGG
jgi:ubiquinone/menaquinone biosynthesis C-methylase UbiE